MKKVTIGVVLYGDKYLSKSLISLVAQDYENIEYIFLDQEEGEHSGYNFVKENLPKVFEKAKMLKGDNLFHSGGHNKIISQMSGEIYICASNDMLYSKDMVSKIVKAFDDNKGYSVIFPKSMQWKYGEDNDKSNIIDSCGIGIDKNLRTFDIGQGEEDKGQYDDLKDIFGISGSLFAIKKRALRDIKYKEEYFDEDIHYKNDIDLSFRLRWAGKKILFAKDIVVYHDRQVMLQKAKSHWVKESSLKGDIIVNYKNIKDRFPKSIQRKVKFYHLKKRIFLALTSPKLIATMLKKKDFEKLAEPKKKRMPVLIHSKDILKFIKK